MRGVNPIHAAGRATSVAESLSSTQQDGSLGQDAISRTLARAVVALHHRHKTGLATAATMAMARCVCQASFQT